MSQSIRSRMTLIFVALAVVPLLAAAAAGLALLYRYTLDVTFNHMHETAARVATQVHSELARYQDELQSVLRYRDFSQLQWAEQRQMLEELIAENDFFIEAMLLDTTGRERIRISSREIITAEDLRDRSKEPRFIEPVSSSAVYFSKVFIDPVRIEPLLAISIPLPDLRSGKPAGVLSVDTRLTRIWNLIASLEFDPGSDVYLLNDNGRLIAHRNPSLVLSDTRFNHLTGPQLHPGLRGNRAVLADALITAGQRRFHVVAELDAFHALSTALTMLGVFAVILLSSLLAAAMLVMMARRMILDRLYRVSAAARAIAAGELNRRVAVERDDELGILSQSFNDMTQSLVDSLEQVHLSEEQFRQLAETVPQVVWLSDWGGAGRADWEHYRLLYVSPLFEHIWGRSLGDLYADPLLWSELIHPDDRERVRQLFFAEATSGGYVCEYRILRPDGSLRYIRDQGIPIRNEAGEVYRIAGLAQDVTQLRENERRLVKLNRSLQTLSACNEALVRAAKETQLLQQICQNLVGKGGYRYAAIRYLDAHGRLTVEATECGATDVSNHPQVKETIRIAEQQATDTAQPVTVLTQALPGVPLAEGVAVAALPLIANGATTGVLSVLGAKTADQEELTLLRELADDVAFGIHSLRIREERDAAQKQLVRERDRARQYLQIAAVMILALNERGEVVLINRKGCDLLGYSEEEIVGRNWFETFVPASLRAEVMALFSRIVSGQTALTEHYENPVVTRSGEQRLISFYNNYIRDENGQIIGTISSGEDITERARNQARLERLTRALQTLSTCNETLVRAANEQELLEKICRLIIDTGGYYLAWIAFVDDQGQLHEQTRAGRDDHALALVDTELESGAAMQQKAIRERHYVHSEPSMPWTDSAGSAVTFALIADDTVFGVLSVYANEREAFNHEEIEHLSELADDLAFGVQSLRTRKERDRAENALRELNAELEQRVEQRTLELQRNEERFRTTVASLAEGVVVTDIEGNVQLMNPEAEHLLGWPQLQMAGHNLHERVHLHGGDSEPTPFSACPQHQAVNQGKVYQSDNETFRRSDGTTFPVALVAAPLKVDDAVVGTVVAFQDISLRKEVERMKDELISTVSHELRTPLTSLRGFIELMLMRKYPEERQKEFLGIVHRETLRLNKLVDEFLDIQRMESGRQEYLMQPVSLGPLLTEIVTRYRNTDTEHEYRLEVATGLPDIIGDRDRILQAMENLLSNAMKFSPEGGPIVVSAQPTQDAVEVRVTDRGMGIPEEALPRLFDKFFRVERPESPRIQGTGLGLPLLKKIVEAHGGTVGVQSVYGEGSSFWFTLPLPGPAPEAGAQA